jgi:hypothetical protein
MDTGVQNMTWEIHVRIGTFCAFGAGPTFPSTMEWASTYMAGRSYTRLFAHYNVFGYHEDRVRDYAISAIIARRSPAVIGTGWLTHYPLAFGFAQKTRTVRSCFIACWNSTQYYRTFYVNQGWGGAGNGWVADGTFFAGEILR